MRFVRLWFVDVLGLLKSLAIPVSRARGGARGGRRPRRLVARGRARLRERDVIAHPDPRTFQVLPWRPGLARRADVLRRAPARRRARSPATRATRCAACSARPPSSATRSRSAARSSSSSSRRWAPTAPLPTPLDDGAYFDLTPLDDGSDFRRRTIEHLEQMGIPVKASHHEVGPSQHEIDLEHTDALSMADAITTFRLAVKEVAREQGVFATFMPKPLEDQPGSGMHLHLSLFEGERNAFYDPDPDEPLSPIGRAFLAGVLAHARELTAVTNQWVNSYKRLATGFEAPETVSWTRHGAAALVRVPSNRPGRESAARIELRSPDPACNPYLRSRSCSPPGCAASSAATSCRPRRSTTTAGRRARCRRTCARRSTSSTRPSSSATRSATGSATGTSQQAPRVGRLPPHRHRVRALPLPAAAVMGDAWIYGERRRGRATARLLAELGFSPRRVAANGSLRPPDGEAARRRSRSWSPTGCEQPSCAELCARLPPTTTSATCRCSSRCGRRARRGGVGVAEAHELLVGRSPPTSCRRASPARGAPSTASTRTTSSASAALELNLATYQVASTASRSTSPTWSTSCSSSW